MIESIYSQEQKSENRSWNKPADFGGLDTFTHISSYLMKDLCDSKKVPELMQAHFDAGEYGVKSEKGFYDYHDGRAKEATKERDEKFLRVYQALYGSK